MLTLKRQVNVNNRHHDLLASNASANKSDTALSPNSASMDLEAFCALVRTRGRELYRDLPWRRTYDPYAIWISEVMLQQTQVSRVMDRWQRWLERFPTVDALAAAAPADVLEEWQGLGYNRRALLVHKASQLISESGGVFPHEVKELVSLPGIGPATAAGIRAFSWNLHGVYLETNVRAVFLHELYPDAEGVPDSELIPLVEKTCPSDDPFRERPNDNPRSWYYALLDYGAQLKKTLPNPGRRSKTHVRQSKFEGSHRQKRATLLRLLLAHRDAGGTTAETLAKELNSVEVAAGREALHMGAVLGLLEELAKEGFCYLHGDIWCA